MDIGIEYTSATYLRRVKHSCAYFEKNDVRSSLVFRGNTSGYLYSYFPSYFHFCPHSVSRFVKISEKCAKNAEKMVQL